jgi:hypothetical protein
MAIRSVHEKKGYTMERKGGNTAVVTGKQVTTKLNQARVTSRDVLPKASETNDELEDELLLIEMSLLRALKRRAAMAGAGSATALAPGTTTATNVKANVGKDKIVAALKAKRQ